MAHAVWLGRAAIFVAIGCATVAALGQDSILAQDSASESKESPPAARAPVGDDATPAGEAAAPLKLEFFPTLESAQANAPDARPIVVVFGATWCGWCRKLKDDSLTAPEIFPVGMRFAWIEVDVDDEPELAARYRARVLPQLTVVDRQGVEIISHRGFLSGRDLAKFLERALDPNRSPDTEDAAPAGTPEASATEIAARDAAKLQEWSALPVENVTSDVIQDVIVLLARPDRPRREAALALLEKWGDRPTPTLLASLDAKPLAIRAAAGQALLLLTPNRLPFDPFASHEQQSAQAAAWRRQFGDPPLPPLRENRSGSETPDAPGVPQETPASPSLEAPIKDDPRRTPEKSADASGERKNIAA